MAIYFLQRTSPVILPVLNENKMLKVSQKFLCTVEHDGKSLTYLSVGDKLNSLRPDAGQLKKNKYSVGKLWLLMLRFYAVEFDFSEFVIR